MSINYLIINEFLFNWNNDEFPNIFPNKKSDTFGGMAVYPTIQHDVTDLLQFQKNFTAKEVAVVTARAINVALRKTKTQMKRSVTADYNLRSSDVGEKNIKSDRATYVKQIGKVYVYAGAESIAHFANATSYVDVLGGKRGGGYIKTKKGAGGAFSSKKYDRNTSKSGVYFTVVKGHRQKMPGAFLVFFGTSPVVMARGHYMGSGHTKDFQFTPRGKKGPLNKINSKSVFWGVMHQDTMHRWQPWTMQWYMSEATRLYMHLIAGVKF